MTEELATWAAALGLSGLVSYFTTIGTLNSRLGVLEEREDNHYQEILRRLSAIDRKLDRFNDDDE